MRVLPLAALLAVFLARPAWVHATTADDLCAPAAPACVIDTIRLVDDDSVLDFGSRPLTIARRGSLDSGGGSMTIRAGSLTIASGGALFARGSGAEQKPAPPTITIQTIGGIVVNEQGRIDLSSPPGGAFLDVSAGGNVDIHGVIAVQGTSPTGTGGRFTLNAEGAVRLVAPGEIRSLGGASGVGGGDVTISANRGPVEIDGPIDVSGRDGGSISLESETDDIVTTALAKLDATAKADFGDGGTVSMAAARDIRIDGPIAAQGEGGLDAGGTGGDIDIEARGSLVLNGLITFYGAAPDGEGGDGDFRALTGDIVQTGAIVARGRGSDGAGGLVTLVAGRHVVAGPIDAGGGKGGAGDITITAPDDVTLTADIDGDNDGGVEGGSLTVAGEHIVVQRNLHLNGVNEGPGGFLDLTGCTVLLGTSARLSVGGGGGTNILRASDVLTVSSGAIVAASGGVNSFRYRNPLKPPVVQGTVTPPPVVAVELTLPPCSGPRACGDGTLQSGEECDDGNDASCDGCSSTCQTEACGNGRIDCQDECDDQNQIDGDGCDRNCRFTGCGNGIRTAGEDCDDGNTAGCDRCSALCTSEACGNGVLDCGEDCDDGNTSPRDGCEPDCRIGALPTCGDHTLDAGEDCDDGNRTPCDGCSATCSVERCGNLVRECAESCDDGNTRSGDGCDSNCTPTGCGNRVVTPNTGEQCDDGNKQNGDGCDANCTFPGCGNGIVDTGELCDDGNRRACDGCTETCRTEVCGNGIVDATGPGCEDATNKEVCDDRNTVSGDGCDANCTPTACGNGVVTAGEACDDGNLFDNDGCSAACQEETTCEAGGQELCVACDRDTDCDPDGLCAGMQCIDGQCASVAPVDCNDGNPGTVDLPCVLDQAGNPVCRHTCLNDQGCEDGNECNGTATCDRGTGTCVSQGGGCADQDDCTEDVCVDGRRCEHHAQTGFAGIGCSFDAVGRTIGTAAPGDLDAKVATKLGKLISVAQAKLGAAQGSLVVKKRTKLLRAVSNKVNAALRAIAKAQLKGKISDDLADRLIRLLDPVPARLSDPALRTP